MPGTRGQITKAKGDNAKSVYLSDKFGVWPENDGLHITFLKGKQQLHTSLTPRDGLLFDAFMMLHTYGLREGATSAKTSQGGEE